MAWKDLSFEEQKQVLDDFRNDFKKGLMSECVFRALLIGRVPLNEIDSEVALNSPSKD